MAEAGESNAEFSFAAAVRGYHVYRRVWLPHLGQCLKAEREGTWKHWRSFCNRCL